MLDEVGGYVLSVFPDEEVALPALDEIVTVTEFHEVMGAEGGCLLYAPVEVEDLLRQALAFHGQHALFIEEITYARERETDGSACTFLELTIKICARNGGFCRPIAIEERIAYRIDRPEGVGVYPGSARYHEAGGFPEGLPPDFAHEQAGKGEP